MHSTIEYSTIDSVSKFYAHVMASLESNLITLAVFLDLSKAFDTMDHNILLKKKLHFYGVHNVALGWFRNYFTNRSKFATYHTIHSACHNVTWGVTQGHVLGPNPIHLLSNRCTTCSNIFKMHLICRQFNSILHFSKLKRITTKYRR